ncbi:UNVERIFIED_CONTAM: hypothetical protein FKN15_010015 [Acipenser sinensis]
MTHLYEDQMTQLYEDQVTHLYEDQIVKAGLRLFFENAAEDIEKTVENLKLGKVSQNRTQVKGVSQNISYTTVALLPVLTSLFEHIAQHQFGDDVIRECGRGGVGGQEGGDDVMGSETCNGIYSLGTTKNPYVERQRPALGECLARLAAAFPVAYLEPHLNEYNMFSVYNTKTPRERAMFAQPIVSRAKSEMLKSHFIPTMEKLKKRCGKVVAEEDALRLEAKSESSEAEAIIKDEFSVLCRDLYALYPLLIRYVDNNRATWLTCPDPDAEDLFRMVGEVFIFWSKSHSGGSDQERTKKQRRGDRYSVQTSLIVAALKKMLPIGLNMCSPADQELINLAKLRYSLKDTDEEVREFLTNNMHLQGKVENSSIRWQMALYKELSGKAEDFEDPEKVVKRVQEMERKERGGEEGERERGRGEGMGERGRRGGRGEREWKWESKLDEDYLYMAYSDIMAKSCHSGEDEGEGGEEEEGQEMSFEEKEMEKQRLLYQQARLHNRGAAEMVLQMISACKGETGSMVSSTLKLGISLLNGGNCEVQQKMLDYLKEKKEVGFFQSTQALMQTCRVIVNNYLRTQTGNTTTINIIICTVDYLLRLQGPCTGNQQSLAHSRLWDAVVGFLHVFAHMMMKLAQDSSQIGLLKELLDLQKDMVVMLLSLLEGNVVNGTIARQMVDMLVESSSNVEMILKFFDMFLKLKDIVASDAFKDYVTDPRGLISKKDFQKAMDSQKQYSPSEIQFLLSCSEADENEMINYEEFANRFQEPAKDIGFNIAVLLTNLSEHVPHDTRLRSFLVQAESILGYFQPFLGRIEVMGPSKRIERIYFEISETNRAQWEMPQVKESKRQFIFDVVNEGGESEKMEMFVNFCEDTIFEMQIASQISECEEEEGKEESDEEEGAGGGGEEGGGDGEAGGDAAEPGSAFSEFVNGLLEFLGMFTFRNLRRQFRRLKRMTLKEGVVGLWSFFWALLMGILHFVYSFCKGFFLLVWTTLFGGGLVEGAKNITVTEILASMPDPTQDEVHGDLPSEGGSKEEQEAAGTVDSLDPSKGEETTDDSADMYGAERKELGPPGGLGDIGEPTTVDPPTPEGTPIASRKVTLETKVIEEPPPEPEKADVENGEKAAKEGGRQAEEGGEEDEKEKVARRKKTKREKKPAESEAGFEFWSEVEIQRIKFLNYLSRNFYNLRFLALFVSFALNFILLFYKVSESPSGDDDFEGSGLFEQEMEGSGFEEGGDEDEEDSVVYFFLEESTGYMQPTLSFLSILHTLISFLCIIGYNCLKVPLVIFKREKELARKLEFDGLYITEQPEDDDIKGQWDRLVLNTP